MGGKRVEGKGKDNTFKNDVVKKETIAELCNSISEQK